MINSGVVSCSWYRTHRFSNKKPSLDKLSCLFLLCPVLYLFIAGMQIQAHSLLYFEGALTQFSGYHRRHAPFSPSLRSSCQVLRLKHRDEVKGPFPTAEEPSDHVVLAADYRFNRPATDFRSDA